ncbi:hypothetical protein KF728_08450 [Candidatus Obscuribacterales bacterium]|nr:hypothetical protein [Candidatus Obscuribacterales bacterium]
MPVTLQVRMHSKTIRVLSPLAYLSRLIEAATRIALSIVVALILGTSCNQGAVFADDSEPAVSKETGELTAQNPAITEWFDKYDQIRNDAEMSLVEKLKYGSALKKALKSGGTLSTSAEKFVKRMVEKYATAAAALSALTPPPEVRALQQGYVQYFNEMEKSFSECLNSGEVKSTDLAAKASAKERIENLDDANKKLDENLRKKFDIPKHNHS